MPFVCPECTTPGALEITRRLELPADRRSDEITLQIVRCSHCGFAAVALYEESRRGALDEEHVDHRGYRVRSEELRAVERLLRRCRRPGDAHCDCEAHRALGGTDASGRSLAALRFAGESSFPLVL